MLTIRKFAITAAASVLLSLAISAPASAHGPQRLPDAACNDGTSGARTVGSPAYERIPHTHTQSATFTRPTGCYHLNPTVNH